MDIQGSMVVCLVAGDKNLRRPRLQLQVQPLVVCAIDAAADVAALTQLLVVGALLTEHLSKLI